MKIVAIASGGGHWIELMRLKPLFDEHEVVYMTTNEGFRKSAGGSPFYVVPDVSRWNKLKLIWVGMCILRIMRSVKPDVVISTGAAPGVIGLLAGKVLGCKTIWIDSMCNMIHTSLSGRFAARFCDRAYTQWPQMAGGSFIYHGNLMQ